MPTDSTDPTDTDLILTWNAALDALVALCEPLTPEQWAAQTPCPGWSVADVVAHTIDTEAFVGGLPRPEHTPDWDDLPHATGDFGRFTEVGVDARRGRAQDEVLAELRATVALRRAQLDALVPGAEVIGPHRQAGAAVPHAAHAHLRHLGPRAGHPVGGRHRRRLELPGRGRRLPADHQRAALPLGPQRQGPRRAAPCSSRSSGPGCTTRCACTVDEAGRGVAIPVQVDPDVQINIMWAALVRWPAVASDLTTRPSSTASSSAAIPPWLRPSSPA